VIVAVENVNPTEAEVTPDAITDPQHLGNITGALGALKSGAANSLCWRRKPRLLLVITGPGLIVMGGAERRGGGIQVYAQMGLDYG
jgi:hypothetical protein